VRGDGTNLIRRGAGLHINRAGRAMARHPLRTGAGAIGLGGMMGARAMNRRGSQNYPMY